VRRSSNLTKIFVLLCALVMTFTATAPPKAASAQSIVISVSFGPPPIPYYVQPPNPYQNYIWSPGYWGYDSYSDSGYYWVPGTWVPAPQYGLLWTPGYWAFNTDNDDYVWSSGYWASQVGYYGGVNYGYGYYGRGYAGGRWRGHEFEYNTAVSNVDRNRVRTVYRDPGVVEHTWNRVSYNGGRGGVSARPTANELAVQRGNHVAPTNVQVQHARYAATNRASFSAVNHGRPVTTAVARPYTSANRFAGAPTAQQHAAPQQQHAAPQQQHAAPQQQHAAPQQQHAAPQQQHAAPQQQHAAPQQQHAAPQQQRAAPQQQHAAPQQQRAAPQQQRAAPQQQRAAPQQQRAAPQQQQHAAPQQQQRAAPQQHAAPADKPAPGGGGGNPNGNGHGK
jgi:hypothetical protein